MASSRPPVPPDNEEAQAKALPKYALDLGLNLLIGFKLKGKVFDSFDIQPVRGSLKRELLNLREANPARESEIALKHALKSIGGLEGFPLDILRKLTMFDVQHIMLVVTAAEKGILLQWDEKCGNPDGEFPIPGCGETIPVNLDLKQVEIVPGTVTPLLLNDGRVVVATEFFDPVEERSIPFKVQLPNLSTQSKLFRQMRSAQGSMGDITFHQISSTTLDFGVEGRGLSMAGLDDMPDATISALLDAHSEIKPTQLDGDVEIKCSECGREHIVDLPIDEWLRPFDRKVR